MSLSELYRRQYPWRPWKEIYPFLGDLAGQTVLDLGCGIGDQSADLARRGASVVGVDANESFVETASTREISGARFVCADLRSLRLDDNCAQGIWTSFTVAYVLRLGEALESWARWLSPGGWLAVTEVDDLFGHEPLEHRYRALIEKYYDRSFAEGLYAFRSRDRLCDALAQCGWTIEVQEEFRDRELAFEGRADEEVLCAWRSRLEAMMPRFVERFGEEAVGFRGAFLDCLASNEHRSRACVWFLLARRS